MPPQPCRGCKFENSHCCAAGLINRLAVESWVADLGGIECPDYDELLFRGLEGVRP